jgi:hypothetical protein
VSTLRGAPFNLDWGASVFAKVSARNINGYSIDSVSGNGAVIITTPDAPINLQEDYSLRTKS